jgi:hypothetical protein
MKCSPLQTWVDSSLFGRLCRRRRHANRAVVGRRRFRPIPLENLEERIALSTILPGSTPALVHAASINQNSAARSHAAPHTKGPILGSVANSTSDVNPNGDVVISSLDGNSAQTFRYVGNGWKLIGSESYQEVGIGNLKFWVKDNWAPDGTLVEDAFDAKAPGSQQFYHLTISSSDKTITMTLYGYSGPLQIYDGLGELRMILGTVTWVYARTTDGGLGKLLQYHVNTAPSGYGADWQDPTMYPNDGYYSSGWLEFLPNSQGAAVPTPLIGDPRSPDGFLPYVSKLGAQQQRGNPVVAVPPDVTEQHGTVNGHPADTFWNSGNTKSVTFVYNGAQKKHLIAQIYGSTVGGKWVTVTDHSKAFMSQTATFAKFGGTLETSVTVLTAADTRTATLYGAWTSGTAVYNATGVETAINYLDFSSVTVQIKNGKPVTRSGVLDPYIGANLGKLYATDTYNDAGTGIDQRVISQTKSGPTMQLWSSSGNSLQITWNNPDPSTSVEITGWQFDTPHVAPGGFTMNDFHVDLVKPIHFFFNHGEQLQMTQYTWWARWSAGMWNYREQAQTGRPHLAHVSPSDQLSFSQPPVVDPYWNKA